MKDTLKTFPYEKRKGKSFRQNFIEALEWKKRIEKELEEELQWMQDNPTVGADRGSYIRMLKEILGK